MQQLDGDGLVEGNGEDDERTEQEVPGGHGKRVIFGSHTFAEDDVHGEPEGSTHGDGIAEKRGRVVRDACGGGEDSDSGKRDGHAHRFAPGGLFESKQDSEGECIDGRHADDDGRVSNVGVAKAKGETELVEGDAEQAKVGEGPVIAKNWRGTRGEGRIRFAKHGEPAAKGSNGQHKKTGGYDAERREGQCGEMAKTDFDDEEIDGPDGHEECDGDGNGGARGGAAVGGFYEHGSGSREGGIILIIREGFRGEGSGASSGVKELRSSRAQGQKSAGAGIHIPMPIA